MRIKKALVICIFLLTIVGCGSQETKLDTPSERLLTKSNIDEEVQDIKQHPIFSLGARGRRTAYLPILKHEIPYERKEISKLRNRLEAAGLNVLASNFPEEYKKNICRDINKMLFDLNQEESYLNYQESH